MDGSVGSKTTTTQRMACFRGLNVDLVTKILQFLPTATTRLVGGDLGRGAKWYGDAVADNGCLYCIPSRADRVLEYNPVTNTSTTIVEDLSKYGLDKWDGAVIERDGNIYGLPFESGTVLIIKPHINTVDVVDVSRSWEQISWKRSWGRKKKVVTQKSDEGSYRGGVLAADGMIYIIPFDSDQVLRFDPTKRTATSVGQKFPGDSKWDGGVLGKDGCIYGIPFSASRILRFDPTTQIASLVGDDLGNDYRKWEGGAVDSNGIIYGVPSHANQILRFDPATEQTSLIGSTYDVGGKWSGGVMGDDDNLYCIPHNAEQVLRLNTATLKISLEGDEYEADCKWSGGAKGKDGIIYGVPYHHKRVLQITPMTITGPTESKISYCNQWIAQEIIILPQKDKPTMV